MGFVVLHLDKSPGNEAPMTAHIARTVMPPNADPTRTHLNKNLMEFTEGVKDRTEAIQHRLEQAGLERKIGKNQVQVIRVMLTGSHDDMKLIEAEGKLGDWCNDNLDWLAKTFGKENVVSATLHMDEDTPHIHASVVPVVTGERRKKKSNKPESSEKKQYRKKNREAPRLCADDVMARDKLKSYQDGYAVAMNKYGLQRGIEGSEARHISTQQYYRDLVVKSEDLKEDVEMLQEQKEEVNDKIRDLYDRKDEAREKFLNMDEYVRRKEKEITDMQIRLKQLKQDYEPYIDSIRQLGANIVWFMPIQEKGLEKGVGSPYCIRDYYSVNAKYGTIDDFKRLITAFHEKGIGVIIDWVPNHTSWDNPWMVHKDWYTQDSIGNVIHPAGTSWRDVADLNYDNLKLRQAMIDAMKYWVVDVGVDGFRCDAVDYMPADFLKQANDTLLRVTDHPLLLLAEGKREDHFLAGYDLNYGWDLTGIMRRVFQRNNSAADIFKTNEEEYAAIPQGKHKLRFITNHDETARRSPIEEWGGERGSMSAWVITTFLPGCPLIYSSQEVGHPSRIRFFDYVYVDWNANNHLRKEYEHIMAIYNANEVVRKGELKTYPMDDVALFERYLGDKRYVIAANVRNASQSIILPAGLANQSCTDLYTGSPLKLSQELTLEPYEYKILKLK